MLLGKCKINGQWTFLRHIEDTTLLVVIRKSHARIVRANVNNVKYVLNILSAKQRREFLKNFCAMKEESQND